MQYEFTGCDNPKCPDKKRGRKFVEVENIYFIPYSMKDAPALESQITCPTCGIGKITRIVSSSIQGLVKASLLPDFQNGQSYMTKIAGQDTKITFVDHPHTDPRYEARVAQAAKRAGVGGISQAYYNEKFGKVCVDVASPVKDPLGTIAREQRHETQTVKVNQPFARKPVTGRKKKANGPIANQVNARIPWRKTG